MKLKYRTNPIWYAVAILLAAVVVSTNLLFGLFARYTTTGDADDGSGVATFSVTQQMLQEGTATEHFSVDMSFLKSGSGATLAYNRAVHTRTLKIENRSEVKVAYTVSVKNEFGNLPLKLTLANSANQTETVTVTGTNKAQCSGEFAPNSGSVSYTLTIAWDTEAAGQDSYIYNGELDSITVELNCTQID